MNESNIRMNDLNDNKNEELKIRNIIMSLNEKI
jgi:hypothetical protein